MASWQRLLRHLNKIKFKMFYRQFHNQQKFKTINEQNVFAFVGRYLLAALVGVSVELSQPLSHLLL